MKRKLLSLLALAGCSQLAMAASIGAGNVLAIDQTAGTSQQGALFVIDQSSGSRNLFSDFGNAAQGLQGVDLSGVAWLPAELLGLIPASVLVTDSSGGSNEQGALYQIDPATGQRSLLSDFGNGNQGALGEDPLGVLAIPIIAGVLNSGAVLVIDPFAGSHGQGAIFSVNATGSRTVLTDFGDDSGFQGVYPDSMAFYPGLLGLLGASVLVADGSAGASAQGVLFSVNPVTGARSVLSDFGNSAQGWVDTNPASTPVGVLVSPGEQVYVLVQEDSAGGGGAVVQVNPLTGARSLISQLHCTGSNGADVSGIGPSSLAWLPNGSIGVADSEAGANGDGVVFSVNPGTGQCQVLSDFGDSGQGPLGSEPSGVAVAQ